ncbi:VanZ family protein [Neobacillus drentensis]|uniref:VanZ family protein n=1 Tax=Neobacillus drentensis TaxID=220684 RepID=UPI0008340527|nr:VanZ family protein [Neobacillus drentensis]
MSKYQKLIYQLPWIIVVLWMLLIFNFSAQPAQQSDKLSIGITEKVIAVIGKITPGTNMNLLESDHLVRKNAHFFIYLTLAISLRFALRKNRIIGMKRILLVIGICLCFAISDEFHQLFVSGRGAQVKDVFIDSSGAIVGLVIYGIVNRRYHRCP